MAPNVDLNTAGAIASIAGLGATFVKWFSPYLSSRKSEAKESEQVTIEHYKEWLRRREHHQVLTQLEDSNKGVQAISALIDGLLLQSRQSALDMLHRAEDSDIRLDSLASRLADVQRQLQLFDPTVTRTREERSFEVKYLKRIESEYGHLKMVGVPEMRQVKQRFSVAYVSLNVRSPGGLHLRSAEQAFRDEKEMTIQGAAGSGKTTLLHWLALQCAQVHDSSNPWNGGIPFFVPLRKMTGRDSKHPDMSKFVKYTVDPKLFPVEPPRNWLSHVLDSERGVVLIDGVDELSPNDRPQFWEWVDDFARLCHGNRIYIQTS